MPDFNRVRRPIACLLIALLTLQPLAASAQVISAAGAAASVRPTVDAAPNGVPVVQIAAPNGAGVSHNQYQQYSVDSHGVILNNSTGVASTQLAGYIAGNPNLSGGAARLILNEVVGNLPSQLNGYTEVAGTRAEVVIANPNGITCNGCGFINTSRGVLTTGTPVFGGDGSLQAFRVSEGQISIEGEGLDGSQVDQLDLLARSVVVPGSVWAQDLNVVAGANRISHADLAATPIAGTGPVPVRAIDVALLGGMYAGKIRMLATEAGVGVNSDGTLVAQSGDFRLDAAGRITLASSVSAAGKIDIQGGENLDNSGDLYSLQDATLTSVGALSNSGVLAAKGDLAVTAANLESTGILGAGVDQDGVVSQPGGLSVTTDGVLRSVGQNLAGGDLSLRGQSLDLTDAWTSAGGAIVLAALGGNINHAGGFLQSGGALSLSATDAIDNGSGSLIAGGTLSSQSASFSNQDGAIAQVAGEQGLITVSGVFDNRAGSIATNRDLTLVAGSIDNRNGIVQSWNDANLFLTTTGRTDNGAGGLISAAGSAQVRADELSNDQGEIVAGGNLAVIASHALNNAQGLLGAQGNAAVGAQTIDNTSGIVLAVDGDATIAANSALDNTDGRIAAAQDLALTLGSINNQGGRLYAGRDASLASYRYSGAGTLLAGRDLTVAIDGSFTQTADNLIQANRNLGLFVTGDLTNQGTLSAVDNLTVYAGNVANQSGATLQADVLDLTAAGTFDNAGDVAATKATLVADSLTNTGAVLAQDVTVLARKFENRDVGVVASGNTMNLYVSEVLSNLDGGLLYSAGNLAIAAGDVRDSNGWLSNPTAYILNRSADIQAGGNLEITATTLDNQRSSVVTATRTLATTTTLVQERDDGWSRSLVGNTYINSKYVTRETTVTTCDMGGNNCTSSTSSETLRNWSGGLGTVSSGPVKECIDVFACQLVTTTVTTTSSQHYGYADWHVASAASEPTFTLLQTSYGGRRHATISEQIEEYVVSATPEARILVDGNMYLRADTVNNLASRIEAGGNLVADVGTLNNVGYSLHNSTRDSVWVGSCSDIQGDVPGILGHCDSGWIWTLSVNDTITGTSAALDASFGGGKSLSLFAVTVNNATVNAQGLPPGGVNLTVASTAYAASTYDFGIPSSRLYVVHSEPNAHYLVETDPRFTRYASFISSDYMLSRLGLDPDVAQKRLGDGYYEQQLVRDQLISARGNSYTGSYASLDAQYQALLEAGVAYAQAFDIVPGVRLTQEQVASLTQDMVWLEEREVAGERVLVPVVYLAARDEQRATGAILGGGAATQVSATDINNQGTIASSGRTQLVATNDVLNASGLIAGQQVSVSAGKDLSVGVATQAVTLAPGQTFTQEGFAGRIEGQSVDLSAGRDLTLAGGQIDAGTATLVAGRDLTVGTQTLATQQDIKNGGSRFERAATRELGSEIVTTGDLSLEAGNDLTVSGSQVRSGGDLVGVAGNQINIAASVDRESTSYSASSKRVNTATQSASAISQGSTLEAGGSLTLSSASLVTEGATLRAGEDITLQADSIVLGASHDQSSSAGTFSKKGQGSQQQSQFQQESDTARGTIVAAGRDLVIESTGDTTVVGGALAAGRDAKLTTGGDLALLAAQSSSSGERVASEVGRKEATQLNYSEQEVRQLLTTITVGNSLDVQVGGDFQADTGERRADGTLVADRMTTEGVVRGDSRQQVSVEQTGDGANANPSASQVIGDLAGQGIRNGSNESFAPTAANAVQSGTTALQQYVASGLVQVKNNTQLAAVLENSEGATLTYRDDSGRISLTVAGQAKVEEVYNTLRLTETFDVKKFADQQTAQVVTLVAAVVLTVWAPGAGAALVNASGATATAMANAAFISMSSTMLGQLAGGASFDQAFEAGVKAGASAALTAGILNAPVFDTTSGMQSLNQIAGIQDVAGTGTSLVRGDFSRLGDNLLGVVGRGLVSASVNSVIYHSDFGNSFQQSVISDATAVGASAIGMKWGGGTDPFMQTLAHAGLGAVTAELRGQDAVAGAIGGATESLLDNLVGDTLPKTKEADAFYAAAATLMGGIVASAAGYDGLTAAQTAQNAAVNNRLATTWERSQLREKAKEIAQSQLAGKDATSETLQLAEEYWYGLLLADTNSRVDQTQAAKWAAFLDQIEQTNQPGLMGSVGTERYLQDVAMAHEIVSGLAAQNIILTGVSGNPIVADGAPVVAFQATPEQYADSYLFNTTTFSVDQSKVGGSTLWQLLSGGNASAQLVNGDSLLIQQFGSLELAADAQARQNAATNRADLVTLYRWESSLLTASRLPTDGIVAVYPLETVALMFSPARVLRYFSTGEKAVVTAETAGSYDLSISRIVTDGEMGGAVETGSVVNRGVTGLATETEAAEFWSGLGAKNVETLVDTRKFADYIFKPGADHGKDAVFKSLGYSAEDSAALAATWETQAAEKFAKGEYSLGKADQYGQRIDIEIVLPGKGSAVGQTSYLKSGWMIQTDGSIKLNTPFSGFTRSGK
jgi:filamentous hemagglutinin family protein